MGNPHATVQFVDDVDTAPWLFRARWWSNMCAFAAGESLEAVQVVSAAMCACAW